MLKNPNLKAKIQGESPKISGAYEDYAGKEEGTGFFGVLVDGNEEFAEEDGN